MTCRRHRESGVTLIEVLATAVLLALVAALLLGGAGISGRGESRDQEVLRTLVRQMRDLDSRARLAARDGEPVALAWETALRRVALQVKGGTAPLAVRELPEDAEVSVESLASERKGIIEFDATGASPDYALKLRVGTAHTRIEFAGATGWVESEQREAAP